MRRSSIDPGLGHRLSALGLGVDTPKRTSSTSLTASPGKRRTLPWVMVKSLPHQLPCRTGAAYLLCCLRLLTEEVFRQLHPQLPSSAQGIRLWQPDPGDTSSLLALA